MAAVANPEIETIEKSWVQTLDGILNLTDRRSSTRLRTNLSSTIQHGKVAFFLPTEMASLQPENLRYMHRLANTHNCKLIEDRRTVDVQPIIEQRDNEFSTMAMGISLLLNQTGMPGSTPDLSVPHRLNPDSLHIEVADLIAMAAFAMPKSKQIVLLPNQFLAEVLDNDTSPISGYACKLVTADITTKIACFDSDNFRAIGYHAGNQFVMHVFLAGGPMHSPELWTNPHTIGHDNFRFQLFKSTHPGHDFGLMYSTLYLDINAPK